MEARRIAIPDDPDAYVEELVAEHWKRIAELAWRSYQEFGRGCVVVNMLEALTPGVFHQQYLAADDLAVFMTSIKAGVDAERVAEIRAQLSAYDPRTSVAVLAVVIQGAASRFFLQVKADDPPPPEACAPRVPVH